MKRTWLGGIVVLLAATAQLGGGQPGLACATWELQNQSTPAPSARFGHAMAYDAKRGMIVLFGGKNYDQTALGDTWEWRAGTWTQRAIGAGPPPRRDVSMAYDENSGVCIAFGGADSTNNALGDTWVWNGLAWSQIEVPGPSARSGAGMVYDITRRRVVLFGGAAQNGAVLGDTWEFDGNVWSLVAAAGPEPRVAHVLAYDRARQRTVVFGGVTSGAGSAATTTWEWDGSAWEQRAVNGPTGVIGAAAAFDEGLGRVVLFSGQRVAAPPLADTSVWVWDGLTWTSDDVGGTDPAARYQGSMVYNASERYCVLFGGIAPSLAALPAALRALGTNPRIVSNPSSVLSGTGSTIVLSVSAVGTDLSYQWRRNSQPLSDNERISGSSTNSLTIANATSADAGSYDVIASAFCGEDVSQAAVVEVDCTLRWVNKTPADAADRPTYRPRDHAIAYDASRRNVVLFGGSSLGVGMLTSTWIWDGAKWTLASVEGPSARTRHQMAFDSNRGVMVVFGGSSTPSGQRLNDTWEWDGAKWIQRQVSGPSPRSAFCMEFDEARGVMVLFGGTSLGFDDLGDTWEWDGMSWTQRANDGPAARISATMVYDAGRQRVVLFGGLNGVSQLRDRWEWGGKVWHELTPFVDVPSTLRYATLDQDLGRPVAYEPVGSNAQRTWQLESGEWSVRSTIGPPSFIGSDVAFDFHRGVTVLVGIPASGTNVQFQTWELRLAVEGDANADNLIDGRDLSVLLTQFGQAVPVGSGSDLNNDGVVNGADLGVLLSRFGQTCGP